jgi:hypothetical protein
MQSRIGLLLLAQPRKNVAWKSTRMFDFKMEKSEIFPHTISRPIPSGRVGEITYLPVLELKKFLLKNRFSHSTDICV